MKKRKVPSVAEFLNKNRSSPRWRGGQKCITCSHKQVEAVNEELRHFAKEKKAGHAMPWTRFFRERLREVYGLNVAPATGMRHVRECLGIVT